ncbi:MAG: AAA family ATPase [Sphaerochaeta sp.]|jgi:AAA15 family ATPase/GTPase|nr:AAA family ATPase [Sphaerochaeta sp.]
MAATKGTRHTSHVHTIKDSRLLKGSFIFGANASGKSNFVEAMQFARNVVVRGVDANDTSGYHFRLQKGYEEKPGVFQFDFFVGLQQYSYGFALSYAKQVIVSEWLAIVGASTARYVFNRNTNEDGTITVESDGDGLSGEDKNRFGVYVGDYEDSKNIQLAQSLILTDVAKRTHTDTGFFKSFGEAFNWFDALTFIFPSTRYLDIGKAAMNSVLKRKLEYALHYFDTGITAVELKHIPLEKMDEELKKLIGEIRSEGKYPKIVRRNKEIIHVEREADGQATVHQLIMNHGYDDELFLSTDESDGTVRLFDLIPLLLIEGPRIVVIDEIGRSLHSKLLVAFIERFYEQTAGKPIQLIATTHDSNVLDLDLLRQDEIWFVERQRDYNSRLYSLSEFKERFDKNIEREYLLGRYGAIPFFRE